MENKTSDVISFNTNITCWSMEVRWLCACKFDRWMSNGRKKNLTVVDSDSCHFCVQFFDVNISGNLIEYQKPNLIWKAKSLKVLFCAIHEIHVVFCHDRWKSLDGKTFGLISYLMLKLENKQLIYNLNK